MPGDTPGPTTQRASQSELYEVHGADISDRFCIKIATTSPGLKAARILKKEGIATLGTALFSLPQAIGAAQAGMYAISMYYNSESGWDFIHKSPGTSQ